MAKELYVGQISENATEEDVRKLFSVMGTVTSVHLIIDPETREFKRCGYVRMAADVDPDEVVETLDGALLVDRVITVSIARPQKPGMSKSGKSGGAGKPWFGSRGSAGPKSGSGQKSGGGARSGVGQRPASGARQGAGATSREEPKPGRTGRDTQTERHAGETTARPEPKSRRGRKPSSPPTQEGGRTRGSKPRHP